MIDVIFIRQRDPRCRFFSVGGVYRFGPAARSPIVGGRLPRVGHCRETHLQTGIVNGPQPQVIVFRRLVPALWLLAFFGGCASIRTTDPARTATEQFLMTEAVNSAVEQLSPALLRDRLVFVDAAHLAVPEQAFLLGELRARLLSSGVRMAGKREEAQVILEVRSGGVGIDRYDYLLGIPSFALPYTSASPGGMPILTPELAIFKNQKQYGFASVAFVAYWANTGELLAASGPFVGRTFRKDYWFFGVGPRTFGNIAPTEKD